MSYVLLAATGTYLITWERGDFLEYPIIGWEKLLHSWEPICFPPTAHTNKMICYAIPNPEGGYFYYDPNLRDTFYDSVEWASQYEGKEPEIEPETQKQARSNLHVAFGNKVYKNKSFWHFKTPSDEFLFELDGEQTCPDDPRCEKITRDQYFKARKLMDVLTLDELLAATDMPNDDTDQEAEDLI